MKKNIKRIQRWLDRFSCACDNEKWDSALIEADCLSAEVSKAREAIWRAVLSTEKARRISFSRRGAFMAFRTVAVSLLIVFAASIPSALEADKPWNAADTMKTIYVKEDRLSWVTPEEEELLLVLRAEMSKNSLTEAAIAAKTQPKKDSARQEKAPAMQVGRAGKDTVGEVTNEDLLALVQIGEKALRGNTPAIKIIN